MLCTKECPENGHSFYGFKIPQSGSMEVGMNLNKLERKFGRYAISNLSMWMIVIYVIGYVLEIVYPNAISILTLDPYGIMHGQIWRIVTWILIPPETLSIFTVIMLFFYYSIGTSLERTWGTFRYNVYIFSGIFFTAIGAFLIYGIAALTGWFGYSAYGAEAFSYVLSFGFSTYYINMSIFLAFAACFPNMQILLYFIIPLKIKWLGFFYVAMIAVSFFQSNIAGKCVILASLLNFIVFFLSTRNYNSVSPKEIHRKKVYHQQVQRSQSVTRHKCAICGRTELDDPSLEFRFCSKCDGNYEYCQDHLFTHQHIKM